jgi:hypothetical protein
VDFHGVNLRFSICKLGFAKIHICTSTLPVAYAKLFVEDLITKNFQDLNTLASPALTHFAINVINPIKTYVLIAQHICTMS